MDPAFATEVKILPSATTTGGALLAVIGSLSVNEWLGIVGVCVAIGGFAVNTWHRVATYRLQKRKVEVEIQTMKKESSK